MNCKQHYPFFAVRRRKPSLLPLERPQTTIFTALGLSCLLKRGVISYTDCMYKSNHTLFRERKAKGGWEQKSTRKWEREGKQEGVCDSPAFCLVTPQPQIQPLTCWRYIKEINLQWWHFTYQQASRKDFFMQKPIKYSSYLSYNHITKLS